jgi:hypothetical protein
MASGMAEEETAPLKEEIASLGATLAQVDATAAQPYGLRGTYSRSPCGTAAISPV